MDLPGNRLRRWIASSLALGSLVPIGLVVAPMSLADPAGPCSMTDLLACAEQNAALPPSGASDVAGSTDPVLQPGGGAAEVGVPANGGPPQVFLPTS